MMRNIWIMALAALLIACNSQPRTGAAETDKATEKSPAVWVETVLNVEGMTCEGCENAIKAGLETLEGVQEVESSHEEGWTRVKYDTTVITLEEISQKIGETGYTVAGEK